jgi:hypothetical protein
MDAWPDWRTTEKNDAPSPSRWRVRLARSDPCYLSRRRAQDARRARKAHLPPGPGTPPFRKVLVDRKDNGDAWGDVVVPFDDRRLRGEISRLEVDEALGRL